MSKRACPYFGLFHEDVPDAFIRRVFETMSQASHHTFQVLTKRSERLASMAPELDWHENIWVGVSVESPEYTYRIDHLRKNGAVVKFLSLEPLLGPMQCLDLRYIDWVIVGGESGPGARPMNEKWVGNIKGQCEKAGVPFFFKQWGGVNKKKTGRVLQGRTWDAMPLPFQKPNSCQIQLVG